jgi:tetratricopeptide (TPR) repeat protein
MKQSAQALYMGAVVLALGGCATAQHLATPDEGGADWREMTSEHFIVKTDMPSEEAARVTQLLERTRAALVMGLWPGAASPPGRMEVVLFRSDAELLEFAPPKLGGFVAAFGASRLMVVAGDEEHLRGFGILPHELTHVLAPYFIHRLPRWLNEGLACSAETLQVFLGMPVVEVGLAHPGRAEQWAEGGISVDQVVHAGKSEFWAGSPTARGYYGTAWMLTHFLINAERPLFTAFHERLVRGESPEFAWQATAGALPPGELERRVRDYAAHGHYLGYRFVLPLVEYATVERALTPADVHLLRAMMRANSRLPVPPSVRAASLRADVAAALEADPHHPGALLALNALEGWPAVGARAQGVERAHPQDWQSWVLAATVAEQMGAPGSLEIERSLQRALGLAPQNPRLLTLVAKAWRALGRTAEGLRLAEQAARLAPWDSDTLEELARADFAAGRCPQALLAAQQAVDVLPDEAAPEALAPYSAALEGLRSRCAQGRDVPLSNP